MDRSARLDAAARLVILAGVQHLEPVYPTGTAWTGVLAEVKGLSR